MAKKFSVDEWALKKVRLDMADQFVPDVLIGNAADADGRGILLQVTIGGEVADLEGLPACLAWSHPNGNQDLTRFTAVDASKGLFKLYYPPAMMYPGDVTARVSIFAGSKSPITGSRDFTIHVERNPIDEDRAMSDESFSEFKQAAELLYSTNSRLEEAEEARQIAETARATAEELRRQHEDARVAAENERLAAELERDAAELERLAAEAEREAAEEDRSLAELARVEAEAYRAATFAEIEQRSKGWLRYYCADGEWDTSTREPIIATPDTSTLYFVPEEFPSDDGQWVEWMWDAQGSRWEKLGTSQATFEPITADQMDAIIAGTDTDEGGSEVMTRWGLRYWLTKLRGVFAALVHTHSASDITSGTFGTARIADGAVTKDKLEKTLGDSLSRGDAMANNSYIADANDLMAGLRQFGPETANAPVANSYGFIQTYANATDIADTYLWRYQIGFSKGLYLRWKINANGVWSSWMKL